MSTLRTAKEPHHHQPACMRSMDTTQRCRCDSNTEIEHCWGDWRPSGGATPWQRPGFVRKTQIPGQKCSSSGCSASAFATVFATASQCGTAVDECVHEPLEIVNGDIRETSVNVSRLRCFRGLLSRPLRRLSGHALMPWVGWGRNWAWSFWSSIFCLGVGGSFALFHWTAVNRQACRARHWQWGPPSWTTQGSCSSRDLENLFEILGSTMKVRHKEFVPWWRRSDFVRYIRRGGREWWSRVSVGIEIGYGSCCAYSRCCLSCMTGNVTWGGPGVASAACLNRTLCRWD